MCVCELCENINKHEKILADVIPCMSLYITHAGFNGAVGHPRFFELGIAEQDAASFAAGLALRGMVPVFGTYSNFLKYGLSDLP